MGEGCGGVQLRGSTLKFQIGNPLEGAPPTAPQSLCPSLRLLLSQDLRGSSLDLARPRKETPVAPLDLSISTPLSSHRENPEEDQTQSTPIECKVGGGAGEPGVPLRTWLLPGAQQGSCEKVASSQGAGKGGPAPGPALEEANTTWAITAAPTQMLGARL